MKFLVDVNASGAVARWLRDMGHDVAWVAEKDPRMRDEEILQWAVREGRIIVTTDQDFEERFEPALSPAHVSTLSPREADPATSPAASPDVMMENVRAKAAYRRTPESDLV